MGILDAPSVPASRVGAAPIAASTRVFDQRLSVYNLRSNHLLRTRGALGKARAGTGLARIGFTGDSTVGGTGATPGVNAWPDFFQKFAESAGYPTNGSGMVMAGKNTAPDSRWTIPTGWATYTANATNYLQNTTTANAAVFTSLTAGTVARLYYANNSTGPFTVAIDGGTAVAVTPVAGNTVGLYEVTGLANTTHTISVVRTSGTVQILAAEVQASTTGVRYCNAGIGSLRMAGLALTSWQSAAHSIADTDKFNCDLAFIMTQVNDINDGTAVATYKASATSAINVLKANGADVVIVTAIPGNGMDMTPTTTALYQLADSFDVPLVDLQARLGNWNAINALGLMTDNVHGNPAMYGDIGRAVWMALGL